MDQDMAGNRSPGGRKTVWRIGCVSFLNSKPLIDGLEGLADPQVAFDLPSRLLGLLEGGQVDIALCPVIDYFRASQPLQIVPVGGIACRGPTMTVRLFSQVDWPGVKSLHADTDSHTSVALAQVLFRHRVGYRPRVVDFNTRQAPLDYQADSLPDAILLIGDKVVTDPPPQERYPFQADLGQWWHEMTGLPFVFAVWMSRAGADLDGLPAVLDQRRLQNAVRLDEIVAKYAAVHGWPRELARLYLGKLLQYQIGQEHIEAIERFRDLAAPLGLVPHPRSLRLVV